MLIPESVSKISIPQIPHPIYLRNKTSDIPTFDQIFFKLEYDIPLEWFPKVIIDAGANIGLAAVFFANKYPKSKIVSIEPEITNYELLKKNVSYYPNVFCLQKALSNTLETLDVVDTGLGNWGFMTFNKNEKFKKESLHSVETTTVSEIMKQYGFEYIDIFKIDIEGYEKELFDSNYEKWVPRTRCIIIEFHDRMKRGCSKSFFKCISKYNFSFAMKGENLVFVNNNLETTSNNV